MKKSNKLLLLAALSPMIVLGLVHLNLYARYKAGNFVSTEQIHAEQHAAQYDRKELPAPGYLSIKGVDNITIVASDTFAVEYEKISVKQPGTASSTLHYDRRGDTLDIMGYDTVVRDKNQAILPFPGITLYCRRIPTMEFNNTHLIIKQEKGVAPVNGSFLILKNSVCSLGDLQNNVDPTPCHYDSLRVQEIKSYLSLNPFATIRELQVELDSFSIIDDVAAKIGNPAIRFNDHSTLHLRGANIRKLPLK